MTFGMDIRPQWDRGRIENRGPSIENRKSINRYIAQSLSLPLLGEVGRGRKKNKDRKTKNEDRTNMQFLNKRINLEASILNHVSNA